MQKKGKNEHDHWGLGLSFWKELEGSIGNDYGALEI